MQSHLGPPFSFSPFPSQPDTWHRRLAENIAQLFVSARLFRSSANGTLLHTLEMPDRRWNFGRAQGCSLAAHIAVVAAVALSVHHIAQHPEDIPKGIRHIFYPANVDGQKLKPAAKPSEGQGSGGHYDSLPVTKGHLAFRSVIPIIPPRPPQNENPLLPQVSTVLDPLHPSSELHVQNLGLPWMPNENDSQGPGGAEGYGKARGHSMGDSGEDGPGGTEYTGTYAPGTTYPQCLYCPDPSFSEEARSAKLQGIVTLQLLVKPDGRVTNARVTRGLGLGLGLGWGSGLGLGLDEKALEAVHTWRFKPAPQTNGRGVAASLGVQGFF